ARASAPSARGAERVEDLLHPARPGLLGLGALDRLRVRSLLAVGEGGPRRRGSRVLRERRGERGGHLDGARCVVDLEAYFDLVTGPAAGGGTRLGVEADEVLAAHRGDRRAVGVVAIDGDDDGDPLAPAETEDDLLGHDDAD